MTNKHKKNLRYKIQQGFIQNKRIIFIVLGVFFSTLGIISFYNLLIWYWSWFDLFIAILMLFLGFCFFPFTYHWQKKVFGSSLFNISFFTAIMFGVFIGSTISLLQDIFQGDFIFTIRSSLVVLVVIWWWSLIVPITRSQWQKHFGKNINILLRKVLFIGFVVLGGSMLVFDIIGSFSGTTNLYVDTNNDSPKTNTKNNHADCFASQQNIQADDRIDAYITSSNIPQEGKITKHKFSADELTNLKYYIEGKSDKKSYYFSWEICNENTKQSLLDMFDGGIQVEKIYPGSIGGYGSNLSPFNALNFEQGDYSLNIFSSKDNKHWNLVKRLLFSVE